MLSALVIVSCKLALTGHRQRDIKITLPLWVLSQSYRCHDTDIHLPMGDFCDLTQARWGAAWGETSASPYIPLHRFYFCQRCTRSLEQRLFSATWQSYKALKEMQNMKLLVEKWAPVSLGACSISEQFNCQVKNCSQSFEKLEAN